MFRFPEDHHTQLVRPIHLFNCFLSFGHIVSLNIGNEREPTIVTFVKKSSAEAASRACDYKNEPGTVKLDVISG